MTQPVALQKEERLFWSTGLGTDVWQMFCAARDGDLAKVKKLLIKDASLVRSAYDYRTPMSFAVANNRLEVAEYLLQHGASPVDSGTGDPLIQMARDRGFEAMEELLERALHRHKGSEAGKQIAATIRSRDFDAFSTLLDSSEEYIHATDDEGNQPIHWATMSRQPEMIDALLDRGADINARRPDGARPVQLTNGDYSYRGWRDVPEDWRWKPNDIYLHLVRKGAYVDICMAALKGDEARVRALLDLDPSLANKPSEYVTYYAGSGTPLKNAALAGRMEIVKLLLENGADPNLPEEGIAPMGHALHSAVVYNHIDIVKLLLEHGAHPNVPVESSADSLTAALERGDKAMINLLCSYGAARSLDLLAHYGDIHTAAAVLKANPALANDACALETAAGQGNEDFVRLMLRYQPDLAKQIAVGVRSQGPQDAVKSRELTEFLFQRGMDPNARNWLGITPLHRFAERGDIHNAGLFLEHGADVDAIDEQHCSTPLGWAAKAGKAEMVQFLLEKGANTHLPADRPWARPRAWAERRGHGAILALLKL
ncbi:ankyrin repeat domain-containing protein [Dyadobacter fermentans]|uniref:ankyrin repeat domain-containing protein n=1 Tax=Dyadobacter fermentans TaxID=94254 RepID=UPI001CC1A3AD|nr:ankyrin repeat domain-containing protein [Dyadobacter fermentans]MBZ1361006.1 ankyrin repeat domain-containing protein [Dyadobacter fermentans]